MKTLKKLNRLINEYTIVVVFLTGFIVYFTNASITNFNTFDLLDKILSLFFIITLIIGDFFFVVGMINKNKKN